MRRLAAVLGAAFALTLVVPAWADENPTYNGPTSLPKPPSSKRSRPTSTQRFATVGRRREGRLRSLHGEDDTGAISYANMNWQSNDPQHPSQLWYDVNGNLLGADFSMPRKPGDARPALWGVNPGRWYEFDGHIHWVTKDPTTGALTYDLWMPNPKFVAGGGDPAQPDAAALVKMGKVKDPSTVATIFEFPALWDLIVWVKPNPKGAFAEKDPTRHPQRQRLEVTAVVEPAGVSPLSRRAAA